MTHLVSINSRNMGQARPGRWTAPSSRLNPNHNRRLNPEPHSRLKSDLDLDMSPKWVHHPQSLICLRILSRLLGGSPNHGCNNCGCNNLDSVGHTTWTEERGSVLGAPSYPWRLCHSPAGWEGWESSVPASVSMDGWGPDIATSLREVDPGLQWLGPGLGGTLESGCIFQPLSPL